MVWTAEEKFEYNSLEENICIYWKDVEIQAQYQIYFTQPATRLRSQAC